LKVLARVSDWGCQRHRLKRITAGRVKIAEIGVQVQGTVKTGKVNEYFYSKTS
jgi:hypothetical protein